MAVFSGNGSINSPSFTFSSDTNTGMYRYDADKIAFTAGGNAPLFVMPQRVLMGISGTSSTNYRAIVQANPLGPNYPGSLLLASGTSGGFNGSPLGILYFGDSTHTSGGFIRSFSRGTGAMPQPHDLQFATDTGTGVPSTPQLSLTNNGYLRMASGTGGIQFNGDNAAANALDDYEEGTWTPLVTQVGGTNPTYTASGKYVKIGNLVHCNCDVTVTAPGSGGGGQRHISLPFQLGPSGSAAAWNCTASYRSISALGIAAPIEENRPLSAYAYENVLFFSTPADTDNGIQLFGTWAVGSLSISFSYLS